MPRFRLSVVHSLRALLATFLVATMVAPHAVALHISPSLTPVTPTSATTALDKSALRSSAAPAPAPVAGRADAGAGGGAPAVWLVTSTADNADSSVGNGVCADSQGKCTLRAALAEANWHNGSDRIEFDLAGTAPVLIKLSKTELPLINDLSGGLVIDGYSQRGSRVNTSTVGSNAIPGVELRGTGNSPQGHGFFITSGDNTIRGFLMNNFYRPIVMDGTHSTDNLIAGNLIGFTRTGAVYSYRGDHGIQLNVGANHNTIGTPSLADVNVIGNFGHGIDMYGPGTDYNLIQNNFLCMTPTGTKAAQCSTGIDHNFGPKNNQSGGLGTRERNVIGRTMLNGVEISHGWDPNHQDNSTRWQNNGNQIIGNWIGFRGDGSYGPKFRSGQREPSFNDGNGINVYDGSNNNLVSSNYVATVYDGIQTMTSNSSGNIIRNNVIGESPLGQPAPFTRYGIVVREASKSHVIEGNRISNGGVYGIALLHKDVLWVKMSRNIITDLSGQAIYLAPNPNNSSQGADNMLASPVITSASPSLARGTGIAGATVEVYRASRNAGQNGLPIAYLGSALVGGNGSWSLSINVAAGQHVTALQINSVNNTSMLGSNVTVN